jgi:hypothetical protein
MPRRFGYGDNHYRPNADSVDIKLALLGRKRAPQRRSGHAMLEVSYVTTLFETPVSPGQAVFG